MSDLSVKKIRDKLGVSQEKFAKLLGVHTRTIQNWESGGVIPLSKHEILRKIESDSMGWALTGSGEMLKTDVGSSASIGKNLIPLYDNVATIGGNLSHAADVDTSYSQPTEYIDTGDWFREATAAIRHYEDSMDEYPTGCILALKEIRDRSLIIPGKDYVIETDEYRVTKRIQLGKEDDHFTAYSTNQETYADGRLIHEPFPIPKQSIRRILLVLGYVVKKNGGTMVYNK